MTTRPPLMYGPEVWRADAGVEWTYWDLRYAALCVRDHGGDWDGLDAAIRARHRYGWEARWSHLLDLRERLEAAGLSTAELVADTIGQKGLFPRARGKGVQAEPVLVADDTADVQPTLVPVDRTRAAR